MKCTFSVVLAALFCTFVPALRAQTFVYTTNADNTVTITSFSGSGAVTIPTTNGDGLVVSGIGNAAFYQKDITSIVIPETITNIGMTAFGRTALTSVLIPASVTNIGVQPFLACTNLTSIMVEAGSSNYASVGGVLFDAGTNTLIEYPFGLSGSYSLPASAGGITNDAFYEVSNLSGITLPGGLTAIGADAFFECDSLTTVTLPAGLASLGSIAFGDCTNLNYVCFQGNYSSNFNSSAFTGDKSLTNILYASNAIGWGTTYGSGVVAGLPLFACQECGASALFGDLQVTFTPATVSSLGAQWELTPGGNYQNSGTTNLSPGSYTIAFKPVMGYITPSNQTATVVDGGLAVVIGGYTAIASGSLEVLLGPPAAVTNGAMWEVDGGTPQTNGAILSGLTPGSHTVSFTTLSGWITPADLPVTISNHMTTTVSNTYVLEGGAVGSLTVVLLPQGLPTNAYWQLVGDTNLYTNGATVTNLSPGNHTISFGPVTGYNTPVNQAVLIASNLVTTADGLYTVANPGSLTVALFPAGAASSGRWSVGAMTNLASGATVTNLLPGSYTVSFSPVTGYNTPSNQSVAIASGVTAGASGIYTQTNASVVFVTNGFGSITHPTPLSPGKPYKATAVPKAKNIFVDWIGGTSQPFTVLGTNTTLAFTNEANLIIEANFMTNVFQGAEGTYIGLFAPASVPRQQTNSGAFTFKLASTGSFSGSLDLGGQMVPMSGKFGVDGAASLTTKATKTVSSLLVDLQLDFVDGTVNGSVTNSAFDAALTGERDVFSAVSKTSLAGSYTVVIPGTTNPAAGPFGDSYGTVKVSSSGAISLAGSLADGTALSQSSTLSQSGFWPLYVSLYGGKGSLWGWNYFSSNGLASYPWLSWINTTNSTKTAANRSGFTNQQAVLQGSLYQANQSLPAGLAVTLQQLNQPALVISNLAGNSSKLILHTNKTTGVISGTFANPADSKQTIKVNGIILQNATNASGYFLVTNQSGAFSIGAP